MPSLINKSRPAAFCPGCAHERIMHALDTALQNMGLKGDQIALVSDIGCSGLLDTFFHTHALHGLHGRALTYATGLKLANPALHVIVSMGDGGLGIGGAHFLSACRRNLDLTLLILNNFNYGMTGGQFSVTTPSEAQVESGFLNRLEFPLDICQTASSAGAPYVCRYSSYHKNLAAGIEKAIDFKGFAVVDIWGICTGRYLKHNRLVPKQIDAAIAKRPPFYGPVTDNLRDEYGNHYRKLAAKQKPVAFSDHIAAKFDPLRKERQEIIILGDAGQRVITAGELLCFAGMAAGLEVTQKTEYRGTVRRGPSIAEVVMSTESIDFTGIEKPSVVIALSQEGVALRTPLLSGLDQETLIIQVRGLKLPSCKARMHTLDLKKQGVKRKDWALACLSIMVQHTRVISMEMLKTAIAKRFKAPVLGSALELVQRVKITDDAEEGILK